MAGEAAHFCATNNDVPSTSSAAAITPGTAAAVTAIAATALNEKMR